ncbi:unnamed protein product [Urochloa decumbens]|uniref:Uncharacterized protein n=1 Tax=Urochloa decumbens TaxID=240449 RepID=A0ABC9AIS7_9POAL
MASLQKSHEERAQSAAQKAADELHAARRDDEAPGARAGGGILGSVQDSARSVMGAVQDTFSGSGGGGGGGGGGRGGGNDTTATVDSAAGDTMAAAGGYAEEGKAKARGAADAAMGKAAETKDAAAGRARGAMDAAADKKLRGGESEEDVMLRVKAADQMTGQAFNDVGMMGEEGTGMPRGRRRSSG